MPCSSSPVDGVFCAAAAVAVNARMIEVSASLCMFKSPLPQGWLIADRARRTGYFFHVTPVLPGVPDLNSCKVQHENTSMCAWAGKRASRHVRGPSSLWRAVSRDRSAPAPQLALYRLRVSYLRGGAAPYRASLSGEGAPIEV